MEEVLKEVWGWLAANTDAVALWISLLAAGFTYKAARAARIAARAAEESAAENKRANAATERVRRAQGATLLKQRAFVSDTNSFFKVATFVRKIEYRRPELLVYFSGEDIDKMIDFLTNCGYTEESGEFKQAWSDKLASIAEGEPK